MFNWNVDDMGAFCCEMLVGWDASADVALNGDDVAGEGGGEDAVKAIGFDTDN